jgi:hypothetical protein
MDCSACGEPLEPEQTTCRACGALAIGDVDELRDITQTDAPTQVMPAVKLPDGSGAPDGDGTAPVFVPPLDAPIASSDPLPAVTPTVLESRRSRYRRFHWRETALAALTGAGATLAMVIAVMVVADVLARLKSQPESAPGAALAADATPQPEAEPMATPTPMTDANACAPRQVSAPEPGRWRIYRAEFGPRAHFDYLHLKLRRDGGHEQAASATAELMTPADASARYGVETPSGADLALVIAFEGPVSIGGPWGARPEYGALREFRVVRSTDGAVRVVLAVNGRGCFGLSGGWQGGDAGADADISLQIEKR